MLHSFTSSDPQRRRRDAFVFALLWHFRRNGLRRIQTRSDSWEEAGNIHTAFEVFLHFLEAEGVDVRSLQLFKDRTMGTYEGVGRALSTGAINGALHTHGPRNDGFYYFTDHKFRDLLPFYLEPLSEDERLAIKRAAPAAYEAYRAGKSLKEILSQTPSSPENA